MEKGTKNKLIEVTFGVEYNKHARFIYKTIYTNFTAK
jgi:hypothetical protein